MKYLKTIFEKLDTKAKGEISRPTFELVEDRLLLSATIASQDFNTLSDQFSSNTDSFPLGAANAELTNAGSRNTDPTKGMTFKTFWTETRGLSGPKAFFETGDKIGVNSFVGLGAPDLAASGAAVSSGIEHNYVFNEGNGLLALVFDPIDLSGHENRELSLNYWFEQADYRANDYISVTLEHGTVTQTLLNLTEAQLDENGSPDNGSANWHTLALDLDPYLSDGNDEQVKLTVNVDIDAGFNVFFDDILFTGDEISQNSAQLINFDEEASGNALSSGNIIDNQWAELGITISSTHPAMLFDSSNPTGGDDDLLSTDQGLVMILSEDGDTTDPDDNADGGTFTFSFDSPKTISHLGLLDIDEGETVIITTFDENGNQLDMRTINGAGNNELQIAVLDFEAASTMTVTLSGSGAITSLSFEDTNIVNGTNDSEEITGNGGDDILNGEGGDDTLRGRGGNDEINGGEGNDIIRGGAGDDDLNGGSGSDWIRAGTGDDTMSGDEDNDYFIFGQNLLKENKNDSTPLDGYNNTTLIEDFEVGLEKIVIQKQLIRQHTTEGVTNNDNEFGFSDLLQLATEADANGDGQPDVILTFMSSFGANRIIISGISLAQLSESDFIFGGQTSAKKFEQGEGVYAS